MCRGSKTRTLDLNRGQYLVKEEGTDSAESERPEPVKIHSFVLITNHQLSEKRPASKTPRSILTSCVARVWNFISARSPVSNALWMCVHSVYSELLSLVLLHGSCSFIPLILSFPYLVSKRPCVRVRAHSYQLAHTSMFKASRWISSASCCRRNLQNGTLVSHGREISLIWRITC